MGTLYPQDVPTSDILADEEEDEFGTSVGEDAADDPVTLANSWLPSSLGLTFYFSGDPLIECDVWGARYESLREDRRRHFKRTPISEQSNPERVALVGPAELVRSRTQADVLGGRARLEVLWRPLGGGHLVTVTLVNVRRMVQEGDVDPEMCLHQVGFRCTPGSGQVLEYPSVAVLGRDPEDEELRLLHRRAKVYAIGHGCAAIWEEGNDSAPNSVCTELLPSFEVPPVNPAGRSDRQILKLTRLADMAVESAMLADELTEFVDDYEQWIRDLPQQYDDIPDSLDGARSRVLARLDTTVTRLRRGIALLRTDAQVLRAFRLANRAMLMQMRHSKEDLGGKRKRRNAFTPLVIDYESLPYQWRPFQLAFQLLTVSSVASPADEDRQIVDLIWFPTGGGKTEAYLAVAAFQIFLRRLQLGDAGAGTTVITRYTLRLLTTQQFQRAAALACACERIRRELEGEMGSTPISIGLWVGNTVTPGRLAQAREKYEELLGDPEPKNPFQFEECPWCGTEIIPGRLDDDAAAYGIRATNASFEFFCPTDSCSFHTLLPIAVVDDHLYQNPPAILLATVDKFARLAWEEGGGAFFGALGHAPPSLIIQDEMHLLSGPLGTTVGMYEGAIEELASWKGVRPKVIASTATIRRADEQALGLFGRRVSLFPPPGLVASDSYFAKVDEGAPGRLYVGLMSQSHTPHTTTVHVAAALLQSPAELGLQDEALDAYWTLVAYHNSVRELGRTMTLARDDIPARIKVIAADQARMRKLTEDDVVELTSNVGPAVLPSVLARAKSKPTDPDEISLLATTNMLSVGVDIPRLGLMLMNGQPKTTAEYIQATSRVGRGQGPGLVVAMYVSTKPRDRSHYEGFVPYHSALYRYVEPTSVTPYSLPSRERSLHAALVILMRHGAGLTSNDAAGRFRADAPATRRVVDAMMQRANTVDSNEAAATELHIERLVNDWHEWATKASSAGRTLYYVANTKQHSGLLRQFGESVREGWPTLNSMRNVDRECAIKLLGED
jgi:hypothetical protein